MASSPGAKKRHVVHSAGRWRIRRPHGGRPRPLRRGARSQAASGVLRRKPGATHRRGTSAIPARPGQLERYDYEYRRNGTVNLFVVLDVHRPWRMVKVTERRAAEDYARCMRDLVDIHYPDAEIIRVVQDNLSTHSASALYQTFPPAEARQILRRLEFHYTPRHASWLNTVEIEIGVLRGPVPGSQGSTIPSDCAAKSPPGSGGEMPPAPASNGCSQQTRLAPKWAAHIRPLPKSHNRCAEVLVAYETR
jgi:hypothetical protein